MPAGLGLFSNGFYKHAYPDMFGLPAAAGHGWRQRDMSRVIPGIEGIVCTHWTAGNRFDPHLEQFNTSTRGGCTAVYIPDIEDPRRPGFAKIMQMLPVGRPSEPLQKDRGVCTFGNGCNRTNGYPSALGCKLCCNGNKANDNTGMAIEHGGQPGDVISSRQFMASCQLIIDYHLEYNGKGVKIEAILSRHNDYGNTMCDGLYVPHALIVEAYYKQINQITVVDPDPPANWPAGGAPNGLGGWYRYGDQNKPLADGQAHFVNHDNERRYANGFQNLKTEHLQLPRHRTGEYGFRAPEAVDIMYGQNPAGLAAFKAAIKAGTL